MPTMTIVTPAFNEAKNLPVLYERLKKSLQPLKFDWNWIVVDDHSSDDTFQVLTAIAEKDSRVQAFRLARNYSSHTAITCGLHHAKGDCAVVLAADLQDPPEIIPQLLAPWYEGSQVVWAARDQRLGEKRRTLFMAQLYYILMRHVFGMKEMPAKGADFWLMDKSVVDAFCQFRESNVHILALITWMGFRQATITYDKQARLHGRSGFNLNKRLKLVMDSITSFTYLPIRLMSYLGFFVALGGFTFAGMTVFEALSGNPPPGYASLMVAVLVIGGILMLMMGILGEYVWRALDESRRRPRFLIESMIGDKSVPRPVLKQDLSYDPK